jgi:hypothetical protein
MTPLFRKLNLKDQSEIIVLDAPESFETELAALEGVSVRRSAADVERIEFAIAFVQTLAEVGAAAEAILPRAASDGVIWFAYPKGTSKRYRCEFNRDNGWAAVEAHGFEGVRMVAIDEDWSALRFRRSALVKRTPRGEARGVR